MYLGRKSAINYWESCLYSPVPENVAVEAGPLVNVASDLFLLYFLMKEEKSRLEVLEV